MKCSLFDIPCHVIAWATSLQWYVYALLALAVGLLVWVLYDKIKGFALLIIRWGGWRAAAAAVLVVVAMLAAFWPRKHVPDRHEHVSGKDAADPVRKPHGDPLLRKPGESMADWWERTKGS